MELQIQSENTLHNIQEMKKNYENKKVEQEFENIERYKEITDSNRQLISEIKKNDRMVENIVNSLPYCNENK